MRDEPAEWDAEDWQAYFDERAGILEFSEGLSREQAEAIARADVYAERKRRRELVATEVKSDGI